MNLSQFPILAAAISNNDRMEKLTQRGLDGLEDALDKGGISAARFKDVKSDLNRAFEDAWKATVSKIYLNTKQDEATGRRDVTDFEHDLYYTYPQCHTAVGLLKKIEKSKLDTEMVRAAKALLKEIGPLAVGVNSLKDKIVKREPKAPEDVKARFSPEAVRGTALEAIKAKLEEVCEDNFKKLIEVFVFLDTKTFNRFRDSGSKSEYDFFVHQPEKQGNPGNRIAASKISRFVAKRDYRGHIVSFKDDDAIAKMIRDEATRDAEQIRDSFIYKNLAKLASIVNRVGKAKVEIVGSDVDMGGLRGVLRITFANGATFMVTNSVVFVINSFGTQFNRYPLTFSNVRNSNGAVMKQPSEEKMNDAKQFF